MAVYDKFLSSHFIVPAIVPKDITGAAQNGIWLSMKDADKIIFVIAKGAWAGGTPAITLEQALDTLGTSPKALAFTEAWSIAGTAGAPFVKQAVVANTFSLTVTPNVTHHIEISSQQLDRNNGYKAIRLNVASPGANADLLCVLAICADLGYQGDPATQLYDPRQD